MELSRTQLPGRSASSQRTSAPGHFLWIICALLFFAATVSYADRQILGILAPILQREIGWSEAEYGIIVVAFQAAYAAGLIGVGRFVDAMDTRLGYALALALWSFAAMAHGLVTSVFGFGFARFLLRLGEAGNFPAAVKAVSDMFPRRVVSSVVGICGFGGAVGGMLAAGAVGLVLQATGSYVSIFALAGFCYLAGLTVIHVMTPRVGLVSLEEPKP